MQDTRVWRHVLHRHGHVPPCQRTSPNTIGPKAENKDWHAANVADGEAVGPTGPEVENDDAIDNQSVSVSGFLLKCLVAKTNADTLYYRKDLILYGI